MYTDIHLHRASCGLSAASRKKLNKALRICCMVTTIFCSYFCHVRSAWFAFIHQRTVSLNENARSCSSSFGNISTQPAFLNRRQAEAHQSFFMAFFTRVDRRTVGRALTPPAICLHCCTKFAPPVSATSLEMQAVNRVMTLLQYMMYDGVVRAAHNHI
jgi:hypothetical protein